MLALCVSLMFLALIGLSVLTLQRWAVGCHVEEAAPTPRRHAGISVLKPLCGTDDALEENLAAYAAVPYPNLEILLGVRDAEDPAYAVACEVAQRWPERFRVVLQRGEPGLNPKVNQLITLERTAKHELLLVSDSNTRPAPGYFEEIAALFEAPDVACVTHPVSGAGHVSLGALLDNLHMASSTGAGQIAAKRLAQKDLVVGKSMALRRSVLDRIGGFWRFRDYLAEDYVIGTKLAARRRGRTVLARTPIFNVAVNREVTSFRQRYFRWSVIHRTAVTLPTYLGQGLLNPSPLAALAYVLEPRQGTASFLCMVVLLKALIDVSTARALGCGPLGARALCAVPVKDAILFAAWLNGLIRRTVVWRGKRLRVGAGSRLIASGAAPVVPVQEEVV
ncbi:MAG: glycosyltransferase [Myxococcaceae bacterium]